MPILTFLINIGGVKLLLLIFSLALLIPVWWGGEEVRLSMDSKKVNELCDMDMIYS